MSLQLSIPDSILEAIRLPSKRVEKELLDEKFVKRAKGLTTCEVKKP